MWNKIARRQLPTSLNNTKKCWRTTSTGSRLLKQGQGTVSDREPQLLQTPFLSRMDAFSRLASLARQDPPALALVLGAGLSALAHRLEQPCSVAFAEVPGMSRPSVTGHGGRLTIGGWAGK